MEQIAISGWDGQPPSDQRSTPNLLHALNLPTPTRSTVVKLLGDGVPGAVGQGRAALPSGLEVPWINRARKVRQGFSDWRLVRATVPARHSSPHRRVRRRSPRPALLE